MKENDTNWSNVKLLVDDYGKRFPPGRRFLLAKKLVDDFKDSELFQKITNRNRERFSQSRKLIENFKKSGLFAKARRYDLFRALKLKLSENDLSDITADMLNPQKSPFGKRILIRLLEDKNKAEMARLLEKISFQDISVRREESGDNSRIDIRVSTTSFQFDNIVVDFEMKVKSAMETQIKEPQTEREWKDLIKFAEENEVKRKNIAAFFVTPYGTRAKSAHFIPIERRELNQIILDEIQDTDKTEALDHDGICALRHFFGSSWFH